MEEINPAVQDRGGRPLNGRLKATAAKPTKPMPDGPRCRGAWSRCGGENASISASWNLCKPCTDARKAERGKR